MKISVAIITKNEENNIERCISSIKNFDEVVVVDSGSSDNTVDICRRLNCKVINTEWLGFGPTKQLAVSNTKNDWVLSIDADEVLTKQLVEEISALSDSTEILAYKIKRRSFYLGRLIKFSGWQNDYPIRLFNKCYVNFDDKLVHEKVIVNESKVAMIENSILHYPYPDIHSHIAKINTYTNLGARELKEKGVRKNFLFAFISGFVKFLKTYFFKLGFLDGKVGLILAVNSSFYSFLKYCKLWLMNKK